MTSPDQPTIVTAGENDRNKILTKYLHLSMAGNHHAFALLYDDTSPLVYGIALRMLANSADAEDLVLEVYTQAWRSAADYNCGRGTVLSWLVTIVRSRAIDKLRSRRSWENQEELRLHLTKKPSLGHFHPAVELEQKQTGGVIRRAVENLPVAEKMAIKLCYFNELSHSEVAEKLGEPLGTVKTRIRRGLQMMRERMLGENATAR